MLIVLLVGCSVYRPQPVVVQPFPGPIVTPTTPSTSTNHSVESEARAESEQVSPPRPLPPPQPARQLADGSRVPAVQGLLATAERERRAGRLESASVALERAQRLAPQSALVYQRLAEIRLQQKRAAEAEQFARKGAGFATGPAAQAVLWRLIAEARRQQGRHAAAQEALSRATELETAAAESL